MKTEHIAERSPSPWIPESDPLNLAILGKSVEELGEAVAKIGRCIVQGVEGRNPETGEPNLDALRDEFADVLTSVNLARERFAMCAESMSVRMQRKSRYLRQWHVMLVGPADVQATSSAALGEALERDGYPMRGEG